MDEISKFSGEVSEKLGYYVYRLIDPRNGLTFYVGKGKGNRVFAHVNDSLKLYTGEKYLFKEDSENDLKLNVIRAIKDSGLNVIHVIQKWGLTEKEAFLIESVLIDVYGLGSLSNKVKGHGNCGAANANTIERDLSCEEYEDTEDTPDYIIIKVKQSRVDEVGRYYATKWRWRINLSRIKRCSYALSVTDGIVREVYKIDRWEKVKDSDRYEFFGDVAEEKVRKIFLNKKIPEYYTKKGMQNPVLYKK